jgi:hypothetical protein
MKPLSVFILWIFLATIFNSCKKGCTDPKADNYTASATVDDASCWGCDSVVVLDNHSSFGLTDMSSLSPRFDQIVLLVRGSLLIYKYSGNKCLSLGLKSACTSGNIQNLGQEKISLTNVTSDTISLRGDITFFIPGSNTGEVSTLRDLRIAPNSTISFPTLYYNCITNEATGIDCDFDLQYSYY